MKTSDWPYEADPYSPFTRLRVPVVHTIYPEWPYVIALYLDPSAKSPVEPTRDETVLLAAFLGEQINHRFNERGRERLAGKPFDIAGDVSTFVFRKYADGDWGYGRPHWYVGPPLVPAPPNVRGQSDLGPLTLLQLMDFIHNGSGERIAPRWQQWKDAHPHIFGGAR